MRAAAFFINMINIIETHKYIISTTLSFNNISVENQIQQCLNKDSLEGVADYGSGTLYRYDDDIAWLTFRTIIKDAPIQDIEI
jgi:hypothetical protein